MKQLNFLEKIIPECKNSNNIDPSTPPVKTLGFDLVLPCLPSWLTTELNEGWGAALCDGFWGVTALTGGGPPVGGGPRGAPGWKVVGRDGFTNAGVEPTETSVFYKSLKN